MFGYVAEFMYQSDAPLASAGIRTVAGQRASAQSTRTGQSGELLGPQVIREVEEDLQRLAPGKSER
ncbi:hypothetical protein ACNKHL_09955 [Shigella flexneri]